MKLVADKSELQHFSLWIWESGLNSVLLRGLFEEKKSRDVNRLMCLSGITLQRFPFEESRPILP